MEHLGEEHAANKRITTITAHVKLATDPATFVTGTDVLNAVRNLCTAGILHLSQRQTQFKNCIILRVRNASTSRPGRTCEVSVKVFKNMMLHIVGAHSVDMIHRVIAHISMVLQGALGCALMAQSLRIPMVNYAIRLPSSVDLYRLVEGLRDDGVLVIFNPQQYAGARVKLQMPSMDDKFITIMMFASGKVIVVIPETDDRDGTLTYVQEFITSSVVNCKCMVGEGVVTPVPTSFLTGVF